MSTLAGTADRVVSSPFLPSVARPPGFRPVPAFMPRLEAEEHRQVRRRPLRCGMSLAASGSPSPDSPAIRGECMNVSEGGLYGTVPTGCGVSVGQRYTFHLTVHECGPEPGDTQTVSQQGIIVRTELLLDPEGTGDRVGLAVRLVGRRTGVIPMPE